MHYVQYFGGLILLVSIEFSNDHMLQKHCDYEQKPHFTEVTDSQTRNHV